MFVNDEGAEGVALPPHLVALMQSDLSPASTRTYMTNLYREIPFDPRLIRLYRDWFSSLGEGGAGVIHCAAGKDRTGIGCALTLIALGVDEETVFADYEFTNQAVDLEKRMPKIQARMEERLARKLDPEALRPMLGVEVAASATRSMRSMHSTVRRTPTCATCSASAKRNVRRCATSCWDSPTKKRGPGIKKGPRSFSL